MKKRIIGYLLHGMSTVTASAHCDIPCGIYDPTAAKIAAKTVERMAMQIAEFAPPSGDELAARKAFVLGMTRRTKVKEDHAELCKRELLILWTDFFKPEHLTNYPDLHELVWNAAKLCSKNKQETSIESAKELVSAVDGIAKIFYEVKKASERYDAYQTVTDNVF